MEEQHVRRGRWLREEEEAEEEEEEKKQRRLRMRMRMRRGADGSPEVRPARS